MVLGVVGQDEEPAVGAAVAEVVVAAEAAEPVEAVVADASADVGTVAVVAGERLAAVLFGWEI